jgi:uncharacterized protein with HEPN domain
MIGEATKNLSRELRAKYRETPWKDIAGIRDKVNSRILRCEFRIGLGNYQKQTS